MAPKPADDGKMTAAKVRDLYAKGKTFMRSEALEYRLNERFLTGDQWVFLEPTTNTIRDLPRDSDRVRIAVNRLWPASRTIISKLTSRPLVWDIPPTAADDATLRGAKLAESVVRSLSREHDWEGIREDNFWSAWKGGTAALCVDWDPTAGGPLGIQDTRGRDLGTGDTVEASLSVLDFVIQPGVKNAEKGRWWIRAQALPPCDVKDRYNLDKEPAADATAHNAVSFATSRGDGNAPADLTLVLTYYERPGRNTPGQVVTVVGDHAVETSGWPFPFRDRLNFVIMRETRVEGRPFGVTVLKIARPVQVALNQEWSSIVEHTKLAGNARLAHPMSMTQQMEELTDLPAEFLPYPDGVTPPQWIAPPHLQGKLEEAQAIAGELDDILGVHDVSRGAAPVNIQSGLGISILVEQDATPLGRLTKESALAWGRFASLVLKIYEAKVKNQERRTAVVTTPGQPPETAHWTGSDFQGQTSAVVPVDAVMPRSRAQMAAQADNLVKMGMIQPGPAGLIQYLRIAEVPDADGIIEQMNPDVAKARRENAMMWLGKVCVPEDFDNHATHIHEILIAMKSPRWDLVDDATKSLFRDHSKAHEQYAAGQIGSAAARGLQNPLAATIPRADGGPSVPMEALAHMTPGQGDGGFPPPVGPVAGAAENLGDAIGAQNPDVPPALIQQSL